jgi:phosphatidylserine/phosphatidylglycerophosphate/cardiolipin synthase-like enzyme
MPEPDITALLAKYFLQPGDEWLPTDEMPPRIHTGCRITPLIDGDAYFHALKAQLALIGNGTAEVNARQFVYVAGWYLDLVGLNVAPEPQPFTLDGPGPTSPWMRDAVALADVLKEKAQRGVEVRVLGFVNFSIMGFNEQTWLKTLAKLYSEDVAARLADIYAKFGGAITQYTETADSLENLRWGGVTCCLNIIGHAAGGAHLKMWVIGDGERAVGFTGGMDLRYDRYDDAAHTTSKRPGWDEIVRLGWHDVATKVEGTAAQELYDFFRDMWNEVVEHRPVKTYRVESRPAWGSQTVVWGTSTIAPRDVTSVEPLLDENGQPVRHYVQSLRTVPAITYEGWWGFVAERLGGRPMSFAPRGTFSLQQAWQKAIAAAETYIYMEDWAFWSQDVMVWINAAMQQHPALKVVLVKGLGDREDKEKIDAIQNDLMRLALQKLVLGLSSTDRQRIRVMYRDDVQVHSKSTLIDDHWTIIGSAPCARRGLYTDLEHSIAVIDADNRLVADYRRNLWTGHFTSACPADVQAALARWFTGSGLRANIKPLPIDPVPPVPGQAAGGEPWVKFQNQINLVFDPDARQPWGKFSLKDLG